MVLAYWRRKTRPTEAAETAVGDGSGDNGGQGVLPEGCCVEGSGWVWMECG